MIGNRLKGLRSSKHYSQKTLGDLIGTNTHRISQWEIGKTAPGAEMIARLAQALETSTDYLLGLTDDPTPASTPKGDLSPEEWAVVNAMRRGDKIEAVRVIVNEQ